MLNIYFKLAIANHDHLLKLIVSKPRFYTIFNYVPSLLALIPSILFNSLGNNEVGDAGATAIAEALRVTWSLKILRLVYGKALDTISLQ